MLIVNIECLKTVNTMTYHPGIVIGVSWKLCRLQYDNGLLRGFFKVTKFNNPFRLMMNFP